MSRFRKSAIISAGLWAVFLVIYPACNWITGMRAHVGSFHFSWERFTPFVPAMILPYLSIDLFYIAAPFLARTDRERSVLARRITLAILISGACFLLFPLRFDFVRPHVDGVLGIVFNNFLKLDQPFNQCPSLHVSLCIILADAYLRRLKGVWRFVLAVWFGLIAISPVLTYQHHVIDILGGAAVGIICLHPIGEEPLIQSFHPNHRVGSYYAVGAILLTFAAFVFSPWTWILFWPALSTALVSAGYLFIGPGIYRKKNGKLAWTSWALLAPVLWGYQLSLLYYARRGEAWNCLSDHLWIGRRLTQAEARRAINDGVTAVIDLTAEFSEPACFRHLEYLTLPIMDLTAPTQDQIAQAIAFIRRNAEAGIVYLHCKAGYSRTAAIAGAYLLAVGAAEGPQQAMSTLRLARPSIIVRPEVERCLQN